MTSHQLTAKAVFDEAYEIAAPADRQAYLDRACGDDRELREKVEKLLRAYDAAGHSLDPSPLMLPRTANDLPTERLGSRIGPYELKEQVGEGGMGLVFVAEQHEPIRRKVALKLIKPGMDTRQVIARFEAERQALALMNHPNIAKVHDGGETPSGRPYFVMELVRGVSITEYCDQNRLTPRARLDLFTQVCAAVQHAHQKGIIHRDIKPSNVMVVSNDGTPAVKVIDFGVAKAIGGHPLTEKTIYTQFAHSVGTPLYMSPEQAGQSNIDIDTRTDVYALGVLLYELLTGTTPLDKKAIKETPFDEVLRRIREDETPAPSSRLLSTAELPSIAAQRQTEPAKLSRLLRGDLDWIAMKALDKDRNRRYETANAFSEDIQRHLAHEPVLAGPPTARYRLRKFARRRRGGLAIAAAVMVALTALAGIGWMIQEREAKDAKLASQKQAREEQIASRVKDAMATAHALLDQNQPAAARQRLDVAKELIGNDRASFPELADEVAVFDSDLDRLQRFLDFVDKGFLPRLGKEHLAESRTAFQVLGFNDVPSIFEALACYEVLEREDWIDRLQQSLVGRNQIDSIRRMIYEELLWLTNSTVLNEVDVRSLQVGVKALPKIPPESIASQALAYLRQAERAFPPTHGFYVLRARCHKALGQEREARADDERSRRTPPTMAIDYYHLGDDAIHKRQYADAIEQLEKGLSVEPTHFWSLFMLGTALLYRDAPIDGHRYDAREDFRAAVIAFTGCLQRRPDHLLAYRRRAEAYESLIRYEEALRDRSKVIEISANAFDWELRGDVLLRLGHYEKAIGDYSKAIEADDKILFRWVFRGLCFEKLDQFEKALADYSQASELFPNEPIPRICRAKAYSSLGKQDEALNDIVQAIALYKGTKTEFEFLMNLRQPQYERLFEKAFAALIETVELERANAEFHYMLAYHLATHPKFRDLQRAKTIAEQAVERYEDSGRSWMTLGVVRYRDGDYPAALKTLTMALDRKLHKSPWPWFYLSMTHSRLGHKDEARKYYNLAVQRMDAYPLPISREWLRVYRAEAAELLGIKEEPKAPK